MSNGNVNAPGALERARQIAEEALGDQRDLLLACCELAAMRSQLHCLPDSILDTFVAVASEVDDLPIGSERQLWSSEVRRNLDAEAREYQERVRGVVTDSLRKLLMLI